MRRLARGARVVVATHNPGKRDEIAALLAPFGLEAVSAAALGLPEPVEDAPDFVGNARIKARAAAASDLPALADDSGFCVAALGGAPGVLSARWAKSERGPDRDFGRAMARVAAELGDAADRSAWFVCALCLAWPDGEDAVFEGIVHGRVTWPPRGERGFGYDPIFMPEGHAETFGEMPPGRKHALSHRAAAFRDFAAACLPPPEGT